MSDAHLTPVYFERLQQLFEAALEQPASVRDAFLLSAVPDDDTLRRELHALLAAHDSSDTRLQRVLPDFATRSPADAAPRAPAVSAPTP